MNILKSEGMMRVVELGGMVMLALWAGWPVYRLVEIAEDPAFEGVSLDFYTWLQTPIVLFSEFAALPYLFALRNLRSGVAEKQNRGRLLLLSCSAAVLIGWLATPLNYNVGGWFALLAVGHVAFMITCLVVSGVVLGIRNSSGAVIVSIEFCVFFLVAIFAVNLIPTGGGYTNHSQRYSAQAIAFLRTIAAAQAQYSSQNAGAFGTLDDFIRSGLLDAEYVKRGAREYEIRVERVDQETIATATPTYKIRGVPVGYDFVVRNDGVVRFNTRAPQGSAPGDPVQ